VALVHLANEDRLLAALTGDERLALAGLVRRIDELSVAIRLPRS